jgi:NDP-sugar pyrophosphorylase family protein
MIPDIFTAHRINTIEELRNIHSVYGVEFDVRDHGNDIIVTHDPYTKGELFEDYLKAYKHRFMIINVKCEGIEYRILELLQKYKIPENQYFFLDCSFPMIWKLSNMGETNIAVRYSEYESLDTVLNIADRVKWVWVDCFSELPLDSFIMKQFAAFGLKVCIVSPELQDQPNKLAIYKKQMEDEGIIPDMICTKVYNIPIWIDSKMQVIIPMSGIGKRFIEAGYTFPKPLLTVDNKPIIQHVINLFSGEKNINFICNDKHLAECRKYNMNKTLYTIYPNGKIFKVPIDNRQGPVHAVSQIFDNINDNEPVIISYCDYGTKWNYKAFLKHITDNSTDGTVVCYRGFHPHMLGTDNYAFCKMKNDNNDNNDNNNNNNNNNEEETFWMEDIQEKTPFTNNRMNEWASNGTYYFRTGEILKKYFQKLMGLDMRVNGEFYVSMVYKLMCQDGLKVSVFPIENMLQWGTPYDLEIYNGWSSYFTNILKPISPIKNIPNITTILPMAGAGSRFVMKGYNEPKPLLDINGLPMVIQAINCLPRSDNTIFICQKEHLNKYQNLNDAIKDYDMNSEIISINHITEGQAITCQIGITQANLKMDNPILISACDNGVYYNADKYQALLDDPDIDIIVWSFRNNQTSKVNPNMYAWLEVDSNDYIKHVSCKKFIYDDPLKTHAIIGTMFFRKAKYFTEGLKKNIDENIRTNGEFYVDDVLNQNIKAGLKVKVFEVEHYICWGTPDDYETYKYWQKFFDKCWWHPYKQILDSTYNNI